MYAHALQPGALLLTAINSSPLDMMAAILADGNFKCIFLNKNDRIPISNFFEVCSEESNWQQASIGHGLAPNRRKLLSEPMLIQITDVYMGH